MMSVNYQVRPNHLSRRPFRRPARGNYSHNSRQQPQQAQWRPMCIKVFKPCGACMMLKVETTCQIREIKAQIEEKINIGVDRQKLLFQGVELKDHKTFIECKLPTAIFLSILPAKINITIKTLHGKTIEMESNELEKISSLKERIHKSEGVAIKHQRLICGAVELEDDNCLKYYDVTSGSIIYLALKFRKVKQVKMLISIKTTSHKTVMSLHVDRSQTVNQVKLLIADKTNIEPAQQQLVFGSRYLDNDSSLSEYSIYNGSTLFLRSEHIKIEFLLLSSAFNSNGLANKSSSSRHKSKTLHKMDSIGEDMEFYDIYVSVEESGQMIEMQVQPTDTLASIKQRIENDESLSVEDQVLLFGGRTLRDDHRTLLDCSIDCCSMLTLKLEGFSSFVLKKLSCIT